MNSLNRSGLFLSANVLLAQFVLAQSIAAFGTQAAMAQGSPVPGGAEGSSTYGSYSAYPASGASAAGAAPSAPVPGGGRTQPISAAATAVGGRPNKYRDLPLTVDSTKYRLDELRAMLSVSRPQDMQDSVQELCEWLNDAADAHYRMYLSFAKSDQTRSQANSEKQLNLRFGQLKREAQLLRADLLIKQLRAPEALAPLVDIVVADPRSTTGQNAYKRLVELGFSQAVAAPEAAPAASTGGAATSLITGTAPVTAPVNVPAATTVPALTSTLPVKAPAKAPAKAQAVNTSAKATH